jgi:hypothetical protein
MEPLQETRESAKVEIKKILAENDNKLCLGLVHYLYGPLRGLNFFIENPDIDSVLDAIESQRDRELLDEALRILPSDISVAEPKNVPELNYKVWSRIGLQTEFIILPNEILEQAENTPETYSNIEEAIKGVNRTLSLTVGLQKEDPFFFRRGII